MKFLLRTFLLLVLILVGLVLARNFVVKAALEAGVPVATGLPLSLGKLDISLTRSFVDLETLKLKNPAGFHDTTLADIPKIYVDFNLSDMLKGKIHLEQIEFNMDQFTVVRNEQGKLNLDSLKAVQSAKKEAKEPAKPASAGKAPALQIDQVRLRIGKVVFLDYSGGTPVTKEFLVNIDQTYRDITEPGKLAKLIIAKALVGTTIANLTNFDLGSLEGSVSGLLSSGTNMVGQVAGTAEETAKSLVGAVGGLKNKLKIPFGNKES